jgi:hypothetical protein
MIGGERTVAPPPTCFGPSSAKPSSCYRRHPKWEPSIRRATGNQVRCVLLPKSDYHVYFEIDGGDELDDEDRAALHRELELAMDDVDAGRVVSEEEVRAKLRALR